MLVGGVSACGHPLEAKIATHSMEDDQPAIKEQHTGERIGRACVASCLLWQWTAATRTQRHTHRGSAPLSPHPLHAALVWGARAHCLRPRAVVSGAASSHGARDQIGRGSAKDRAERGAPLGSPSVLARWRSCLAWFGRVRGRLGRAFLLPWGAGPLSPSAAFGPRARLPRRLVALKVERPSSSCMRLAFRIRSSISELSALVVGLCLCGVGLRCVGRADRGRRHRVLCQVRLMRILMRIAACVACLRLISGGARGGAVTPLSFVFVCVGIERILVASLSLVGHARPGGEARPRAGAV